MKRRGVLFALLPICLLASCGRTPSDNPGTSESTAESKLVITGADHLSVREYITLTCTLEGKEVSPVWSIDDSSIATISSTGMVKGKAYGNAVVTATYTSLQYGKLSCDYSITVEDSWAVSSVVNKLAKNGYTMKFSGDTGDFAYSTDPTFTVSYYKNSFDFSATDESMFVSDFYYGVANDLMFSYTKDSSGNIQNAEYLRYQESNVMSIDYNLSTLASSYYPTTINADNVYEITSDYIHGLFFYMGIQYMTKDHSDFATELQTANRALTFTILSSDSFDALFEFTDDNGFLLGEFTFEFRANETSTDPKVDDYLKTNTPSYPEVFPEITKIYELTKNHNYSRKFGQYTKSDGTKFDIGQGYFTEKYAYQYYTDEYIEASKPYGTEYVSKGYIDIYGKKGYADGSYAFTIEGNTKVVIGDRVTNNYGYPYSHWYDYYENATLILELLESDFYTFMELDNSDALGQTFGSASETAKSMTEELFSYYTEMGLTTSGFAIDIKYDESNPNNSTLNFGGLFTYESSNYYVWDDYPYSDFNTTKSDFMDDFLASLEDR